MQGNVLLPASEDELVEVLGNADAPFSVSGGNTKHVIAEGQPLSTSGIQGISIYDPGALTLVAKSGTPVSEIEAALAAENQILAFEPVDYRSLLATSGEPTIGGVVATNTSGPRRVQAGACRDFLLGTRFVDGTGNLVKSGGRVMKNVTGYDLARLMCGAHGTLGVLTEVSLKVLPKPETEATLVFESTDLATSLDIFSKAMASPFEVSGAARLPDGFDSAAKSATVLRIEGFGESVKYRCQELEQRLAKYNPAIVTDPQRSQAIWKEVRDIAPFAGKTGSVWRLSIKPSDAAYLAQRFDLADILLDWAGGRVWLRADDSRDVRTELAPILGHATLIRGTGYPTFQPESQALSTLAKGLRSKFDPKGLLNPGLMG